MRAIMIVAVLLVAAIPCFAQGWSGPPMTPGFGGNGYYVAPQPQYPTQQPSYSYGYYGYNAPMMSPGFGSYGYQRRGINGPGFGCRDRDDSNNAALWVAGALALGLILSHDSSPSPAPRSAQVAPSNPQPQPSFGTPWGATEFVP